MSASTISSLAYKTKVASATITVQLLLGEIETLSALQGFARYKEAQTGRALIPADWITVTEEEFDIYQGSYHRNVVPSPGIPAPTTPMPGTNQPVLDPGGATTNTTAPPLSEVAIFRRGIKRDQSLFPVYKDDKEWDDWQRRMRTQATAQGVENVLDALYTPPPKDYDLFEEQCKYMMAVFTTCVQTEYGKSLIRKYEGSNDAQGLFNELERHAQSSTTAILTAQELLAYITSATLGKNSWNSTTTSFVLHWEEQVRLYERYAGPHAHLSNAVKRTLLQNAVNGVPDLRQVKLNADQLLGATGHTTTYDNYRDLLLSACARYDAEWHPRATRHPNPRRTVYATDISHGDDTPDFGFDTPVSVVSAFRTRMSGSQWHDLDSESQRIWDSLADSAKEVILRGNGPGNRPRQGPRRPGTRPPRTPDTRQVQVHESYPDHNMGSDPDGVDSPDNDVDGEVEVAPPDDGDQYLAMATKRSKPPSPAALRAMMSPSNARGEY
ncbi:MAG: hypothetical protein ACRCT2_00790 [Plesiomonas shigelloides]